MANGRWRWVEYQHHYQYAWGICVRKDLYGFHNMNQNDLQKEIIQLRTQLNNLKASQAIGGSNYIVFRDQSLLEFSMSEQWKSWWIAFRGDSPFPLVNWGFEVYERCPTGQDGTLVTAKAPDFTDGNSSSTYNVCWNFAPLIQQNNLALPTSIDIRSPNYSIGILSYSRGSSYSGNIRIHLKTKSSCNGVILIEETRSQ